MAVQPPCSASSMACSCLTSNDGLWLPLKQWHASACCRFCLYGAGTNSAQLGLKLLQLSGHEGLLMPPSSNVEPLSSSVVIAAFPHCWMHLARPPLGLVVDPLQPESSCAPIMLSVSALFEHIMGATFQRGDEWSFEQFQPLSSAASNTVLVACPRPRWWWPVTVPFCHDIRAIMATFDHAHPVLGLRTGCIDEPIGTCCGQTLMYCQNMYCLTGQRSDSNNTTSCSGTSA